MIFAQGVKGAAFIRAYFTWPSIIQRISNELVKRGFADAGRSAGGRLSIVPVSALPPSQQGMGPQLDVGAKWTGFQGGVHMPEWTGLPPLPFWAIPAFCFPVVIFLKLSLDRRGFNARLEQSRERFLPRLVQLYEKHNPEKLKDVEAMLAASLGNEEDLIRRIQEKYESGKAD